MKFTQNMKSYIERNDINLKQFAKKINVPVSTVHGWLNGVEPKSIRDLKKIATFMGITVDELCFGDGRENMQTDLKVTIGDRTYTVLLTRAKISSNKED